MCTCNQARVRARKRAVLSLRVCIPHLHPANGSPVAQKRSEPSPPSLSLRTTNSLCLHCGNSPPVLFTFEGLSIALLLWLTTAACDLFCCLCLLPFIRPHLVSPLPPPVSSADTALQSNLFFSYLCHSLFQCDFTVFLPPPLPPLCPCVCARLRLADRHPGSAVGGSSPHAARLPRGAVLPVLWLQESLLQACGRHAFLCRYVKKIHFHRMCTGRPQL